MSMERLRLCRSINVPSISTAIHPDVRLVIRAGVTGAGVPHSQRR